MSKFASYEEFQKFQEKLKDYEKSMNDFMIKRKILICAGPGCLSSRSQEIFDNFLLKVDEHDLEIEVVRTGCFGFCEQGPVVKIVPEDIFYTKVTPEDVEEIVNEHILNKRVVNRLLYIDPQNQEINKKESDMNFYKKQYKIALKNCGTISPDKIEEYIKNDGYLALKNTLMNLSPKEVIDEIKKSGLRGRGGGGFSTGLKWEYAYNNKSDIKYIICNADEGDPGAFMDRSILEGDPHSVIEAMIIGGYAIGASQGYVYIRVEYPVAVERLKVAIEQAKDIGLLGENILGSNFDFNLEIRLGAGAFVCGEETALIASIEGERGIARNKPPFPAEKGLFGKPTIINNVETLANIPRILLNGSDWFKNIGTEKSSGTKVFALGGKINNSGLIEVPMGITLREIVYEIGGGIKNNKKFKALQTGGPSGGCLVEKHLDEPVEFDSLIRLGSMMGSGGMIVMDEDNCMVDIARFYLDFSVDESCGKCTPCREGTKRMLEILDKIASGNGEMIDLENLENLAKTIKDSALCGLGQTAPNPILSTLEHFREEYISHIKDKKCPAGVCKPLVSYSINDKCIGCTACSRVCPVSAISGERKSKHILLSEICVKCGNCYNICPTKAISRL